MRRLRPKWCWAAEIKIQIFSYRFGSVQASLIRQPLPVERDKVGLLQQFGTNSQGRANWNGLSSISLVSLAAPLGLPLSPPLSLSFFGLILWRRVALLLLVKTDFATVTSWAWYWLSWAPCLTYLYDGHPHIRGDGKLGDLNLTPGKSLFFFLMEERLELCLLLLASHPSQNLPRCFVHSTSLTSVC